MVTYDFVYELMRAYKGSNLLVNKRVTGGKVKEFLDIPNSYKQTVIDENGNVSMYQYVEFSIPFFYKREKAIEKHLKRIERDFFQNSLLPITDEEIKHYNTYWNLPFIGLIRKDEEKNVAKIEKPDGTIVRVSLEKGKKLPDVFEVLFKPLAYF